MRTQIINSVVVTTRIADKYILAVYGDGFIAIVFKLDCSKGVVVASHDIHFIVMMIIGL